MRQSIPILALIINMLFLCSNAHTAGLPAHPLAFKDWKRVQIHDSRQKVIQLSNQIKQVNLDLDKGENSSENNQQIISKKLIRLEGEQALFLANLQYSKKLSFKDYFDVYLKRFSNDLKALEHIAKRLSKESIVFLLTQSIVEKQTEVIRAEKNSSNSEKQ